MFYVGKTLFPVRRLASHKKILGTAIKMRIIQNTFPTETLEEAERKWIRRYNESGASLRNVIGLFPGKADTPIPLLPVPGKNAAAAALGRKGGQKRVPKGFSALSKENRIANAKTAAEARWRKEP